jgi:hypothetical protein
MADEWYYTKQGQQQGPVSAGQLKQLAASGGLMPTDLVWKEGMANWVPARQTRGLFPPQQQVATLQARLPAAPPAAPAELVPAELLNDDEAGYEDEGRPRRSRRRRKSGLGAGAIIAIIGGVVGVLFVIGGIVVAILVFGASYKLGDGYSVSLQQQTKNFRSLRLEKDVPVEITVTSDGPGDVDLIVYSPNGNLLAQDISIGPNSLVRFVTPEAGDYKLEVRNLGPGSNRSHVKTKQVDRALALQFRQGPLGMPPGFGQQPPWVPQQPQVGMPPQPANRGPPQVIALQPGPDGVTQQGQLTVNDGRDNVRVNSQCKIYTYPMKAGKVYTIELRSTAFDAYLRLENSKGQQLAEDDDSGGGPNHLDARIIFPAQQDDTYRIIATTFAPGPGGAFTLTIRP